MSQNKEENLIPMTPPGCTLTEYIEKIYKAKMENLNSYEHRKYIIRVDKS